MQSDNQPNSAIYEKLIESVVQYISGKKDLLQALEALLQANEFIKEGEISNESTIKNMSKFLIERKDVFGSVIGIILEDFEKNKVELEKFIKLADKTEGMEKELETLGNQLLAQGLISGAAVTTLTGALAGLLTVGGVTGALIGGGAAFVGFVALVAIAAIGYLIYQNIDEIKGDAIKVGKAVTGFVKNIIDKFPTIQARESNFDKFKNDLSVRIIEIDTAQKRKGIGEDETKDNPSAMLAVVKMLQNKEQLMVIKQLVKDKTIKNFSEGDMSRLLAKGLSTHLSDQKALDDLIRKFQPEIMAIGNNKIEEVEKIVGDKVKQMEPDSQVDSPSAERVSEEGKEVS